MKDSFSLTKIDGVEFSRTGLLIDKKVSFDTWLQLGVMLRTWEEAYQFWIGDYLNFGEKRYGEKYAQAVDEQEADTWKNYAWVARSVEMSLRKDILSYKHHEAVAPLTPEEQTKYLEVAAREELSVHDLRKRIKAARPLPEIPLGKYRVIYADPPWKYGDELIEGYGAATHHYQSMSIAELCKLEVSERAADDAVLFLWVTSPLLFESAPVITAWGFEYKSSFVWDKIKHNFGHYNSVRHELLLICTRGSCKPDTAELHDSVIALERLPQHSEKPADFRKLIDDMYPPRGKDRLELFARGILPDHWKGWGDEYNERAA